MRMLPTQELAVWVVQLPEQGHRIRHVHGGNQQDTEEGTVELNCPRTQVRLRHAARPVYRKPERHSTGYVRTESDVPVTEGGAQRASARGKAYVRNNTRLKRDGCVTVCAQSLDTQRVHVPCVLECVI